MTALIKTFDKGIPYEMELVRDTEKGKYVVQFTSCDARAPGIERHEFDQYSDAWNCFARNMHYYNDVVPVPVSEEQFLGLPKGFLYPKQEVIA
jgi:hypothetical protein